MCYSVHMAHRTTLNVSLTPELERFIDSRVASGRYQSASEVVRAGLRLLEEEDKRKSVSFSTREELEAKLLDGIESGPASRMTLVASTMLAGRVPWRTGFSAANSNSVGFLK